MALTTLDGRGFRRFIAAGTHFLRRERGVLNDLNVFPVPDGDTGSNMYLTVRAGLGAARATRGEPLAAVAAAVAQGCLLGARGNSGVILAAMLRGFAHHVRHRERIDAAQIAPALRDAVAAARRALSAPVEGTMLTVAQAAADAADRLARTETDVLRLLAGVVRAANDALERTPEQLPALAAAGVVDAGGAGFCYFIEGALGFLPERTLRATAFPRRPVRATVFTPLQAVGENRFCTEFVLENAVLEPAALRAALAGLGDSLIVAGSRPALKVHLHSARPDDVQALAAGHGTVTRLKVEDMARQHRLLVVDAPPQAFAVAAVVPGAGFDRIARELGADATILMPRGANSSVEDLLVGVNATLAQRVVVLANDANVALAASAVAALTEKTVTVAASRNIVEGLAVLLALADRTADPAADAIDAALGSVGSAAVFFAAKAVTLDGMTVPAGAPAATLGGRLVTAPGLSDVIRETVRMLAGGGPGLVTLYYGGRQTERDAEHLAAEIAAFIGDVTVEWYYGGQPDMEYWISFER